MSVLPQAFPRRLFLNGAAIFGGEAVARCATLLMAVIVARRFGPVALGEYGYALAVASILLLVPDFGMHLFAVRELSTDSRRLPAIFWNIHWLKIFLTSGIVLFVVLAGAWIIPDSGRRLLFYVLAGRVLLQTFSQASMAIFKAFERMHYIAFQQSINSLIVVGWAALALAFHGSLWTVVASLVAGQAVETFLGWRIIRAHFSPGPLVKWDHKLLSTIVISSVPIGITAVMQALNVRIDILVLGRSVPDRVLGQFQAVAWFPVGTFLVASLLMGVLFPKLSRLLRNDPMCASAYVMGLLKNGLLVTGLGSIVLWFAAPALLVWTFGKIMAPAAPALRLLAPMLPLVFLNTVLSYVFIAARRRGVYMGTLGVGVTLGLGLSVFLTAHYGVMGCALADVAREFTMSALYLYFLIQGNHARAAGRALSKVFGAAMLLLAPGALGAVSTMHGGQWSAVWMLLVLMGILALLGLPRPSEWRLLMDDTL